MLLKAGTYRFNDELDMSNIPTGQDNDYSVDIQYNFTINGLGDVLFDCDCIQIGNYTEETGGKWFRVSIDKSTPDVSSMFWGYMRPYENGVWGEGYEDYIDVDTLKNVTIPYDQEVDDTFGTWYITNTNYNEVNAEDTIYTEKSSWYKSVADAIRNKKGTTAPILRDDFASEISSITGGGETPYYDGTVIIETEGVSV